MMQNDKYIDDPEYCRGEGEEIYRNKIGGRVCQKCFPDLRRWLLIADHVFGGGGFGHTDAKHLKFTMDAGRAPSNIVPSHRSDQLPHIGGNSWAITLAWARLLV